MALVLAAELSSDVLAVGTILGVLAAAAAAWAASRSARYAGRIAEVEQERRAEERARQLTARLSAAYVRYGSRHALAVVNEGPADASDVELTIDPPQRGLDPAALPREILADQTIELPYRRIPGAPRPTTTLSWTDAAGARRARGVHPEPLTLRSAKQLSARQRTRDFRRLRLGLE